MDIWGPSIFRRAKTKSILPKAPMTKNSSWRDLSLPICKFLLTPLISVWGIIAIKAGWWAIRLGALCWGFGMWCTWYLIMATKSTQNLSWSLARRQHNIIQWCGPLENNSRILGAQLKSESPCTTLWASDCYIPRAHWTSSKCWVSPRF